jgi:hypothetical protein
VSLSLISRHLLFQNTAEMNNSMGMGGMGGMGAGMNPMMMNPMMGMGMGDGMNPMMVSPALQDGLLQSCCCCPFLHSSFVCRACRAWAWVCQAWVGCLAWVVAWAVAWAEAWAWEAWAQAPQAPWEALVALWAVETMQIQGSTRPRCATSKYMQSVSACAQRCGMLQSQDRKPIECRCWPDAEFRVQLFLSAGGSREPALTDQPASMPTDQVT